MNEKDAKQPENNTVTASEKAQAAAPGPEPSTQQPPIDKPLDQQKTQPTSAGLIVLGWLTYAFWGWLILSIIWLSYIILANFILDRSYDDIIPYAIAASLVLLPIAFICDMLYRKREPVKKSGALMVIMIIHAVIFALLGIGALIGSVFTGISIALESLHRVDTKTVIIMTSLIATVLYAGAFIRTLNPFKTKNVPKIYSFSMLSITVLLLVLAIAGPVVKSIATREDRIIESGLPPISNSINNYIAENNKLPDSLDDISVQDADARYIIDNNLVEYKTEQPVTESTVLREEVLHRYQLCVKYKQSNRYSSYYDYEPIRANEYSSYLSTHNHGAGRQCYKMEQRVYNNTDENNGVNIFKMEPESTRS